MAEWFEIGNATEIPSPSLLLYPERIQENIRRMIRIAGGNPDRLRPHVKTHKIPEIISLKLAAGISRFKCSTIAECEMVAAAGGPDVLLAYPLVGPNVQRLIQLQRRFPTTHFTGLVDHLDSLEAVERAARAAGMQIDLLIDLNPGMNRTGIEPGDGAFQLYGAMASSTSVRAGGLHAYDGHLHQSDPVERRTAWEAALDPVWRFRDRLRGAGLPVPRIIAGGTPTLPFFAQIPDVECSPGTVVLWDSGQPGHNAELEFLCAAVLLTRVVSKPSANRLCLDLGHKAVASEMPHPRVRLLGLEDAQFVVHSEEHLVIETDRAAEYAIGQPVYGIPRHVCPTVALHGEAVVARDGRADGIWKVTARARRLSV